MVSEALRVAQVLSQEGYRAEVQPLYVSARPDWSEVLVVGMSSVEEATRIGAIYQERWGLPAQVGPPVRREG